VRLVRQCCWRLAAVSADAAALWSVLAYSVGLMAMLGFSAAYHLQRSLGRRELLRRLDHAAIFLMIAGPYTPFTACILNGAYATWLTGSMWLTALGGVAVKLAYPSRFEWASTMVYLALGWAVVIFMRPLLASLDRSTLFREACFTRSEPVFIAGAACRSTTPSGTVWYWSPPAFITRRSCTVWYCWCRSRDFLLPRPASAN
jgi:channel protein (hemolysin III family)